MRLRDVVIDRHFLPLRLITRSFFALRAEINVFVSNQCRLLKISRHGTRALASLSGPPFVSYAGSDANSEASRPLVPTHSGHPFRRMAATHPDRSRPPLR